MNNTFSNLETTAQKDVGQEKVVQWKQCRCEVERGRTFMQTKLDTVLNLSKLKI